MIIPKLSKYFILYEMGFLACEVSSGSYKSMRGWLEKQCKIL